MATALDRIIAYKHDEVAALKKETSFAALVAASKTAPAPRGFARRLTEIADTGQAALICELKRNGGHACAAMHKPLQRAVTLEPTCALCRAGPTSSRGHRRG